MQLKFDHLISTNDIYVLKNIIPSYSLLDHFDHSSDDDNWS
jgi:hypothetical protein